MQSHSSVDGKIHSFAVQFVRKILISVVLTIRYAILAVMLHEREHPAALGVECSTRFCCRRRHSMGKVCSIRSQKSQNEAAEVS